VIQEHDVTVVVPITISGPRHCGNSCRFMRDTKAEIRGAGGIVLYEAQPALCILGPDHQVLVWDKRCKSFGYKRTTYCLDNEVR
jgi:hypothetical protein